MLVIDGHNLIPKIPGWSLRDLNDEEQLLQLLQLFARVRRKPVRVFFDGAPVGQSGERSFGMVSAHFVQTGKTADEAIRQYLVSLKKGAKNVTVVTSDRMVQSNARALGAAVLASEDFARQLVDLRANLDFQSAKARGRRRGGEPPPAVSESELNEYLHMFGVDPAQAEKPIELKPPPPPKPAPKKAPSRPPAPRKRHGFPKKGEG